MIVIYNDDFLEKLRRPSNTITIGSFSLDNIPDTEDSTITKESFSEYVLNTVIDPLVLTELIGTWNKDKKLFSLRFDLPDNIFSKDEDYKFNVIKFFEVGEDTPAFAVISDIISRSEKLLDISNSFGQTRNLLNIIFPEDSMANIEAEKKNNDLKFLSLYGSDLGENLYKLDENGNIMITNDSYFKMFSRTRSTFDVEAIPFVRNDGPFIDADGRKYCNDYTYRVYKNLKIFCSGLESDCWIPTKYGLYENREYIQKDGGIRIYGTADYDEYRVFGKDTNRVASGTDSLENIIGVEFEQVEVGFDFDQNYDIDYNNDRFIYIPPTGTVEGSSLNAYVILRAVIRNYNGNEIKSNKIRFYQGTREDEWKLVENPDYTEHVDGKDIPVYLFPWNTKNAAQTFTIDTTQKINKASDLKLVVENPLLNNYFDVAWKLKKIYDISGKFERTLIKVTLTTKKNNNDIKKWNPLNAARESELMLASLEYNHFSTSFYMIQSPKVSGLRLYEFNPIGGYFTAVENIEYNAGEKTRTYWMLAEEKTNPKVRPWWTTYISNEHRNEVEVTSTEYLRKDGNTEETTIHYPKPGEGKWPGYGKFTTIPKIAMRPDIEITEKSTSFNNSGDVEMLSGLRQLTIFDSFSIDDKGYITLNNVKIVDSVGQVQSDTSTGNNIQVGDGFILDKNIVPVTRTLTTYINSKELGKSVSDLVYKNATQKNSGNLVETEKNKVVGGSKTLLKNRSIVKTNNDIVNNTTTDGKTVDNLTKVVDKYYLTDAQVVNRYVSDVNSGKINSLVTSVNNSILDREKTLAEVVQENTQDSVIAFVKEDGTVGYTSKEDGIAIKLITDSEGKIVYDPLRIWDNRRLRPITITISKEPNGVDPISCGTLHFYRVEEDEIFMFEDGGESPIPTWRNMVRRAEISYSVGKKGEEPFIQIIGSKRLSDRKIKAYINGKIVDNIKRADSTELKISYIKRNSVIVRSNCPFKLSIAYNSGFEDSLAFDVFTKEMKSYSMSNDRQTIYCRNYDKKYGRGIYINSMESDNAGVIGKLKASYKDLVETTDIVAEEAKDDSYVTITDKDGVINKEAAAKAILIEPGKASTVYTKHKRTLSLGFRSTRDYLDKEPIRLSTPRNRRVPINYSNKNTPQLRISKVSPIYDENGYVTHSTTLDIENSVSNRYPLSPVGVVSVIPFDDKNKKENFYVYEKGMNPRLKMTSYPGALGGASMGLPGTIQPTDNFTSIIYDSETYKLNKFDLNNCSNYFIKADGNIKLLPARWINQSTGKTYYSIPGAIPDAGTGSYNYRPNTTDLLEDSEVFTGIYNPTVWGLVNKDTFTISDDEAFNVTDNNNFIGDLVVRESGKLVRKVQNCLVSNGNENLIGKSLYKGKFPFKSSTHSINGQSYTFSYFPLDQYSVSSKVKELQTRLVRIIRASNVSSVVTISSKVLKIKAKTGESATDMMIELTPALLYALGGSVRLNGLNQSLPTMAYRWVGYYQDIKAISGDTNSEATFSFESAYPLQYSILEKEDSGYKIVRTPTKLYYNTMHNQNATPEEIFNSINVLESDSNDDCQGKKNTRALDVDITVIPPEGSSSPLFKITNISEDYKNGVYKYNITVIPTANFSGEGRRFCGTIYIKSRVRGILEDSSVVPADVISSFPKVLPLLDENNEADTDGTRPLEFVDLGPQYNYEETLLPENQTRLDSIAPSVNMKVEIYQQQNNILMLIGNRDVIGGADKDEIYSLQYNPGDIYRNVRLGPTTLKINFTAETEHAHPRVHNYDPRVSNVTQGTVKGKTYLFPYIDVSFDDILKSYKPATPSLRCSGVVSEFAEQESSSDSMNVTVSVGRWKTAGRLSPDYFEFFLKDETAETVTFDGITCACWKNYQSLNALNPDIETPQVPSGFSENTYFKIYLPERVMTVGGNWVPCNYPDGIPLTDYLGDPSCLSEENPLPTDWIYYVRFDGDDSSFDYLSASKGKYIVKYDNREGSKRLYISWPDGGSSWEAVDSSALTETINFNYQKIPTGIVCETSKSPIKLYLGTNTSRNTINETITGNSTYVDLFIGEFKTYSSTTSDDVIFKKDTTWSREDYRGYSRWLKYVDESETPSTDYSILVKNSRLTNEIDSENPIVPDYIMYSDGSIRPGNILVFSYISEQSEKRLVLSNKYSVGKSNFSVRKADSLTSDWSYEILSDEVRLCKDTVNNELIKTPNNNLRITFPPNETEDTITRIFKITTNPETEDDIQHEITLKISQGSYLGTVYCEDSNIRFSSDGTYYNGDSESEGEKLIYFNTDIPGSELEFSVLGDQSATAYLSVGEDTGSAYGADFKRFGLNVKLSENNSLEKATKHLVFYRTYNMYDPQTGRLTPNKKEILRVKIVQGYCSLYLKNPVYSQDTALGTLDIDMPIPEYVSSNMIIGSFYDPLIVPHEESVETRRVGDKTIDYRMFTYYVTCEPNENGGFTKKTDEVVNLAQGDYNYSWSIKRASDGEEVPASTVFISWNTDFNYEIGETPYFLNNYETNSTYSDIQLDIYITLTVYFKGRKYRFYSYLKKEGTN